ncbi:YqaJ-like viral recombinase domain-containing protein [uncultured Thiomicrorhabdus sp.]
MANIEQYSQDETISKIYKSYEDMQSTSPRSHLGASIIGDKCSRKLWYGFRWVKQTKHKGQLLRLFQTGHLAEFRFVDDLRKAGVKVYEVDESTGRQFNVKECKGHFGGSMDGVGIGIGKSSKWHLLEFKTHNDKSFKELKSKGVKEAKLQHYSQMCVYMYLGGIDRAYYMAVNKNTDELYGERLNADNKPAKEVITKANDIIFSDETPLGISGRPDWFECKFCDYHDVCHEQKIPDVNCRTCAHATPVDDSKWNCSRRDIVDKQAGCEQHVFIPPLITHSKAVDGDSHDVVYEHKGKQWVNGKNGFNSKEVSTLDPSLLIDKNIELLQGIGMEIITDET